MLFLTGGGMVARHPDGGEGQTHARGEAEATARMTRAIATACGFATEHSIPHPMQANFGPLGFLFPYAASTPAGVETPARLDQLAARLSSEAPDHMLPDPSGFGRFIRHDILASVDRQFGASDISGPGITPLDRTDVARLVANLRTGALDLDSVYGGAALVGSFGQEMIDKLRCCRDRAKLALGCPEGRPDLLRLARLLDPARPGIDADRLGTLPPGLRALFLSDDGSPQQNRAIIGDARNAEDPSVTAIHLAFARLHNLLVDHADAAAPWDDREALFDWARDRVRWTYQWLVVQDFLPTLCGTDTVDAVLDARAPIYGAFHARRTTGDARRMPLPFEFTLAAFAHTAPASVRDALRLGHRLNLPTAQGCLTALTEQEILLPRLAPADLPDGFAQSTPLWAYLRREAELLGRDGKLGPLGGRLVAEVLVGLVTRGLDSYWTQPGSRTERWHPTDAGLPSEMPVTSLPALMRAAELL